MRVSKNQGPSYSRQIVGLLLQGHSRHGPQLIKTAKCSWCSVASKCLQISWQRLGRPVRHILMMTYDEYSPGIAHIAKLLDYVETKRDIWLVMDSCLSNRMSATRCLRSLLFGTLWCTSCGLQTPLQEFGGTSLTKMAPRMRTAHPATVRDETVTTFWNGVGFRVASPGCEIL